MPCSREPNSWLSSYKAKREVSHTSVRFGQCEQICFPAFKILGKISYLVACGCARQRAMVRRVGKSPSFCSVEQGLDFERHAGITQFQLLPMSWFYVELWKVRTRGTIEAKALKSKGRAPPAVLAQLAQVKAHRERFLREDSRDRTRDKGPVDRLKRSRARRDVFSDCI